MNNKLSKFLISKNKLSNKRSLIIETDTPSFHLKSSFLLK